MINYQTKPATEKKLCNIENSVPFNFCMYTSLRVRVCVCVRLSPFIRKELI